MSVAREFALLPEVIVLAAARSHTDRSALRTLSDFDLDPGFLSDLDSFGFISRVDGEWHLEASLRRSVVDALDGPDSRARATWLDAHEHYLSIADGAVGSDRSASAKYLQVGLGSAYHGSELDPIAGALAYRDIAFIESLSLSLQALDMASEQGQRGVLDEQAAPLRFLRGMTLYRQGRIHDAIPILREVSEASSHTREVAIAQHLVARADCRAPSAEQKVDARRMFKKSLSNAASRGDIVHEAHAKHSLAICMLSEKRPNTDRIETLLRRSLELTQETGDIWGQAKVLHTLGQVLSRHPKSRKEGVAYLNESLEIGKSLGYSGHVAAVERSLDRATGRGPNRKR